MAAKNGVVVCTPLECESLEDMVASMEKAKEEGADMVELCMASMAVPCHSQAIEEIIKRRFLPAIVSFRLKSSKGDRYNVCLKVLKRAVELNVEFVEMDYEMACEVNMAEYFDSNSRIIVSNYVNGGKPSVEKLADLIACMQATGADIIKLDICVDYITDLAPIFTVLTHCQVPLIAMAVGSKVAHSKGPILHNPAFRHMGYNGIYVPMLVDDIEEFFKTYSGSDFAGFSVGIHTRKQQSGAVMRSIHWQRSSKHDSKEADGREADRLYTDCEASISAIEDALRERKVSRNGASHGTSPISGRSFVLIGAGGAGRSMAFGANIKGPESLFSTAIMRAKALADEVSGEALPYETLEKFRPETGAIFANSSAIGMEPISDQSPVSKNHTTLERGAEVGVTAVSGVEMFVRQALGQFRLFTGGSAPEDFMRKLVMEQF
ncbi:short-chain dehydrogenase reductase 2a-like [Hibiscus syriacus]|uniref:Short-chain dehydrogenase reductase 2a-like n=1 Tax=Hibiscus syriacus TaxID=106335 RepID=A0A6A3A3T8_HIBSY|nr:short-chain dehydrogenase reductase 2a-like [Hibiscus syriacus]